LETDNIEVQKVAARMIEYASQKERTIFIEKALETDNIEVQKVAAIMIWRAPKEDRIALIQKALEIDNIEVQKIATIMIWSIPEKGKKTLIKKLNKELSNFLIESPLYDESNLSNKIFGREKFDKTGSETTLIGGPLKGKTIVRHILPESFLAWKQTYEDCSTWQEAGFDYVPIEPIQSYFLNKKKGMVSVFSGVMDLNFQSWMGITLLFKEELSRQQDKIVKVLESQNINHGHLCHNRNFVLCFYRDKDGAVNFDKVPRIYAIDFDQAVSENNIE
jgi:hypothetical protein